MAERVGVGGGARLALEEIRHDALSAFRHIGHGAADDGGIREAKLRGVRVLFVGHQGFRCMNWRDALRVPADSGYRFAAMAIVAA